LVGEYHDACSEGFAPNQLERLLLAPFWEEALSAAQDDRKDHQVVFVNQIVLG
jgi:hypothetical protein